MIRLILGIIILPVILTVAGVLIFLDKLITFLKNEPERI